MTIKEKIEHLAQKRYNRTRELVDIDAWYATEYIIELEDKVKELKNKLKNK
jgi:hypothetical protein